MTATATRDKSMARLLAKNATMDTPGILTATRGKLKRLFCLEEGWLIFAASNLVEEQIAEYLVRDGALTPADLTATAAEASRQGKKVEALLVKHGMVPENTIRKAMEGLIETLLSSCLEWPDGEYKFDKGRPDLDSALTVRLSPFELLFRHTRRYPASLDAVRIRIGPPAFRPQRTIGQERALDALQSRGAVMEFLLEACDGFQPVEQLLETTPGTEEETLRTLYALVLLGVVGNPTVAQEPTTDGSEEAPLTEAECEALLMRAQGADYYGILGIQRKATTSQVRRAYYSLARRYHPDRFRSGNLQRYLERIEAYFSKVTEAYNNLFNPELRTDYERHLAETAGVEKDTAEHEHSNMARQNFLKAKQLIQRRRYSEAVKFLENALQLEELAEYHLELGSLLSGNPRHRADAEDHLLSAAMLDPSSASVYVALGRLYVKAQRPANAARMFQEALRWEPESAEASSQLSQLGDAAKKPAAGKLLKSVLRT